MRNDMFYNQIISTCIGIVNWSLCVPILISERNSHWRYWKIWREFEKADSKYDVYSENISVTTCLMGTGTCQLNMEFDHFTGNIRCHSSTEGQILCSCWSSGQSPYCRDAQLGWIRGCAVCMQKCHVKK